MESFNNSFSNQDSDWLLTGTQQDSSANKAGSGTAQQLTFCTVGDEQRAAGPFSRGSSEKGSFREERHGSRIKDMAIFPQRPESKELTYKCTCELTKHYWKGHGLVISSQYAEKINQVLGKQTLGIQATCPGHLLVGST